ncbi:hypothetical protein [Endozoicomonas sp. SCSIO W0465]|uniref:hypothetical protein n=1 Tax=Endozoicomonas sp. SCSIO W0465 TaxID=2918516 RepID=UPI0020765F82|nr:hypothetical protein [Endozoicomonas sp. SCSIO W0465]USE38536.1 hypothetical protein MJO57_10405 [Endozoicomonas sp. SCSIO W0465]
MHMPSMPAERRPAQSTAVSQPQFHGGHKGGSASTAPVKFDRWTIGLSTIDSFLRGMGREAVENMAGRMCRRAERQQGAKSFNLSNLKKDFDACGLPVDDSQGRSQEQKVRIVTGLILRLQTEANSGIADRPLGHGFCALMKKSESSIAEGMQQLLDEVNGPVASEPITGAREGFHAGDGKIVAEGDDSRACSGLPVGQPDPASAKRSLLSSVTTNQATVAVAPPSSYDAFPSAGTRLAHLNAHIGRLIVDQWADDKITDVRNQMQLIKAELDNLESLVRKQDSEKFRAVSKQFEELQVKDFHHRLDQLEDSNISSSRDIQSIERDIARLSRAFGELALAGEEQRLQLVERLESFSHQLGDMKTYFGILNDIEALTTDLNDFKYSKQLPNTDQIMDFFNRKEVRLSQISTLIYSQPAGSQRTELLEQQRQLRDLFNTSKKTVLSNSGPVSAIIENLDAAEALITTSESDPYGFNEHRAAQARGYLDEAAARCETIRDRAQRYELLGRHRNMGFRLQKIAEQKGEIVQKKVKELFDKASTTMDLFPGHQGQDEVAEVEALLEQARIELKALSGSHYDTVRIGLRCQFHELNKRLQPYKESISDSQQTAATSSDVSNRIDPLKKAFDDYWKEYGRKSKDLEESVLKCYEPDHHGEQRKGRIKLDFRVCIKR